MSALVCPKCGARRTCVVVLGNSPPKCSDCLLDRVEIVTFERVDGLTPLQCARLALFIKSYGRKWRRALLDMWAEQLPTPDPVLYDLSTRGPAWVKTFDPKELS